MGFKAAKKKVIECLNSGYVLHEERNDIDIKNLLATGAVSIDKVTTIIGRSRGDGYTCSPHHIDKEVDVHIIETTISGINWYIKWYIVEPDSIFISVHN